MVKSQPEVLYFYGSNCPVCKTMTPFIDEAGEKFEGRVALRKVNAFQSQKLAQRYRVMAVPTTVSISDGAEVTRVVGARTPGGYGGCSSRLRPARSSNRGSRRSLGACASVSPLDSEGSLSGPASGSCGSSL